MTSKNDIVRQEQVKASLDLISILLIVPGIFYMMIYEDVNWWLFGLGVLFLGIGFCLRIGMYKITQNNRKVSK